MGAFISAKFNLEAALKQAGVTINRAVMVGTSRALNRTATSERAGLGSDIARDMGLKVGTVKDALSVDKATASDLSVRITAKGAPVPLIQFSAKGPIPSRGRGQGVSYRNPGAGRNRIPNAFIATMPGGHTGVFVRAAGARRHGPPPNRSQLPIKELFGPSVVKVFEKIVPQRESTRTETLLKNLSHEIEFALKSA